MGILTKARGNYVYPYSDQASTVLDLLKSELDRLHVKITTDVTVTGISPTSHGFTVLTDHQKQKADAVILACGGKANSKLGSDGSGYALAKQLGHTMVPVVPALVQLKVKNHPFAKAAGVRTDAVVTAICHGQPTASDHGELQLTAYGISGIPVFQISRYIAKSLYLEQDAKVNIDFLPRFLRKRHFFEFLLKRRNGREQMTCADYLLGIFHQKLIPRFLEQAHIRMHTLTGDLSDTQIKSLVQVVKNNVVTINTTNGLIMHKSVPAESQQKKSLPTLWNPVMSGTFILPGNCWMWTASAEGIICNGPGRPVILPELLLQTIYHQIDDKL